MSEMIDRVANALREGGSYEVMAQAAIRAMRDLPDALRWEGYRPGAFAPEVRISSIQFDPLVVWQAVIDEALK